LKKGELFFNTDGLMPGKNGEVISRLGAVVDRSEFEKMKTEYYQHRGWDAASGLPTKAKLEELGLKDVAADLAARELLKK
jgi:aldehyde:ferredoxin oxidoreductase